MAKKLKKIPPEILDELTEKIMTHYAILQKQMPYKTGNLAYNALHITLTADGYDIEIDDNIAPYAKWIDRPDYKSYRYWDKAVERFLESLATEMGGILEKGE